MLLIQWDFFSTRTKLGLIEIIETGDKCDLIFEYPMIENEDPIP